MGRGRTYDAAHVVDGAEGDAADAEGDYGFIVGVDDGVYVLGAV